MAGGLELSKPERAKLEKRSPLEAVGEGAMTGEGRRVFGEEDRSGKGRETVGMGVVVGRSEEVEKLSGAKRGVDKKANQDRGRTLDGSEPNKFGPCSGRERTGRGRRATRGSRRLKHINQGKLTVLVGRKEEKPSRSCSKSTFGSGW